MMAQANLPLPWKWTEAVPSIVKATVLNVETDEKILRQDPVKQQALPPCN